MLCPRCAGQNARDTALRQSTPEQNDIIKGCYKPEMREQIRTVMRWSGPRMLFVHPVLAVLHMKETMKAKKS